MVQNGNCPCKKVNSKCLNFVVVGKSGSGKTTLIDSMINYLLGIKFMDDFRYKLIDESNIL